MISEGCKMTKKTKLYFGTILCIIILCVIMGGITRMSYSGYESFDKMERGENLQKFDVVFDQVDEYDGFVEKVENYNDLEKSADLIVKVSSTNERKLYLGATTKTKVTVREVFKGDASIGQSIFVYEPAGFSYSVVQNYESIGGYQLMKTGEEYYLFLQKLKTADGYCMSDEERNTYRPSTATYSKFPVSSGKLNILERKKLNRGRYSYGEVEKEEIITADKVVLSKYEKIKKEAVGKLVK